METWLLLTVAVVAVATTAHQVHHGGKIQGGVSTTIANFPHFLQVQYNSSYKCGASIYNAYTAVTAASCLNGLLPSQVQLRSGSDQRGVGGTLHQAIKLIPHPQWDEHYDYDVGLIIVFDAFNARNAIPLATTAPPNGATVNITGMGYTTTGSLATTLQTIDAHIMDHDECQTDIPRLNITDRLVCTAASSKTPCNYDLGDPLEYLNQLAGIVSYPSCQYLSEPKLYTNVAKLRTWIHQNAV